MQNYSDLSPADCCNVELLEFNDVQKAAMAAALMAVAEEVGNESKTSAMHSGDVIDLLSSSEEEDNSDCEIYGVLMQDTGQQFQDVRQVVPIEMKFDIKQELEEPVAPNTLEEQQQLGIPSGNILNMQTGQLQPNVLERVVDGNYEIGAEEQVSTYEQSTEEPNSDNYHIVHEPFIEKVEELAGSKNSYDMSNMRLHNREVVITSIRPDAVSNMGLGNRAVVITNITTVAPALQVATISSNKTKDGKTESPSETKVGMQQANHQQITAGTFATDNFGNGNDEVTIAAADTNINENDDDDVGNGADEVTNGTDKIMDEVIELDSDDDEDYYPDEDMDEETEQKLVELIESDCEDSNVNVSAYSADKTQEARKTIDMLMHYICVECEQPCGTIKKWKAHLDTEHGYNSIDKLNLQTIINKIGELCYQCKQCFHKFDYKTPYSRIMMHRITHSPFTEYIKCRLCEMRYNLRVKLKYHLKRDHKKICKHYLFKNPELCQQIDFYCPVCNTHLKTRFGWRKHLEEQHDFYNDIDDKFKKIKDDVVECIDCEKRFRNRQCRSHLLKHARHKSFHCKICKKFKSITIAHCSNHIRIQHYQGGKHIYVCRYCDAKFDRLKDRRVHLRDKHHYRRVQCSVCKKKFATAALLLSHINFTNHQKLK